MCDTNELNDTTYNFDAPFLPAYLEGAGDDARYLAWCDVAKRWNTHSPENGYRSSHCHCAKHQDGYNLVLVGTFTPEVERQARRWNTPLKVVR